MSARRRSTLGALASGLLAALLAGCGGDGTVRPPYANNDLQLLTAFTAKELCACVFVMRRDEVFCERFARQSPNVKTFRIDRAAGTVDAQAVLFFSARARYTGPRRGCVLE